MGYRIRVVPEVEEWLAELRESDPGTASLLDEAVDALREGGAGLGPPLVVTVEALAQIPRPDLESSYQRQLEMLTRVRRAAADEATARKGVELQIEQLEGLAAELGEQRGQALETGDDELAAYLRARQSFVADQLADLHRRYADLRAEEERLSAAMRQLQLEVDAFRDHTEVSRGAENAARHHQASPLALKELRPGAPGWSGIRILFTVEPPDTAVLLAGGTERDWLRAWYAETILHCQVRYERDQGSTG